MLLTVPTNVNRMHLGNTYVLTKSVPDVYLMTFGILSSVSEILKVDREDHF